MTCANPMTFCPLSVLESFLGIPVGHIAELLLIPAVIGLLVVPGLIVIDLVCVILAAVKASNGARFKYSLAIPFIK